MSESRSLRSRVLFVAKVAMTIAAVVWILSRIELAAVLKDVSALSLTAWIALIGLHLSMVILLGIRLAAISGANITATIAMTFRAQFFMLVAPAQIGTDTYRVIGLAADTKRSHPEAAAFVVFDRAIGAIAVVIVSLTIGLFSGLLGRLVKVIRELFAATEFGAREIFVGLLVVVLVGWVLSWLVGKAGNMIELAKTALGEVNLRRIAVAMFLSALMVVFLIFMTAVIMIDQMQINWLAAVAVPPAVLMITMLFPLSISGIGVREASGIVLYAAFGIGATQAVVLCSVPFIAALVASAMGLVMLLPRWFGTKHA